MFKARHTVCALSLLVMAPLIAPAAHATLIARLDVELDTNSAFDSSSFLPGDLVRLEAEFDDSLNLGNATFGRFAVTALTATIRGSEFTASGFDLELILQTINLAGGDTDFQIRLEAPGSGPSVLGQFDRTSSPGFVSGDPIATSFLGFQLSGGAEVLSIDFGASEDLTLVNAPGIVAAAIIDPDAVAVPVPATGGLLLVSLALGAVARRRVATRCRT